ncbi:MAG: hypothetical protein ACRBDL_00115 [Alphaproteobacteria bacterium]
MGEGDEKEQASYILFGQYLDVCNKALELGGNRFPYKQIFNAAKRVDRARKIEVKIGGVDESYVIQMQDGQIVYDRHDLCADCNCDGEWNIHDSYLIDVVKNSDLYIQNPAKINWEWILE